MIDISITFPQESQEWARANRKKINKELIKAGLFELCQIDMDGNDYRLLIKKKNRKKPAFDTLLNDISDDEEWRIAIENAISAVIESPNRGMDYLDLESLNPPFISPVPKGKKLTKSDLEQGCTERDLEEAAISNGGAFRWLPSIPGLVINKVESDITPKIRTDVSSYLYPKVVSVTLTVVGLLSLIAAVMGLFLSKNRIASPLYVDWPATLFWAVVTLGIVACVALFLLLRPKLIDSFNEKVILRLSDIIGKHTINSAVSKLKARSKN